MKIKRFKLNDLSANELRQKEMNAIIGGANSCGCSCAYADSSGSSTSDNMQANYNFGYVSDNACNLIEKDEYEGWITVCRPKA